MGSPWSNGAGSDGTNGIGDLTTLESSAKSLFRGWTTGMTKQYSRRVQFQWNYQRDPFNYYYLVANNFQPEYSYFSRDQRHRFNAFGQVTGPCGIEISWRFSARSAEPTSIDGSNRSVRLPGGRIEKRYLKQPQNGDLLFSFDGTLTSGLGDPRQAQLGIKLLS